jgi:hypothetical protein
MNLKKLKPNSIQTAHVQLWITGSLSGWKVSRESSHPDARLRNFEMAILSDGAGGYNLWFRCIEEPILEADYDCNCTDLQGAVNAAKALFGVQENHWSKLS